ncbi:tyrosyl-DNA phosphodiesterase 1-like [Liolophura sinensis]|uniref:tyrosyl-DNA phosphodiesterase 1-like n=1 Tax=Liolophura sinensis TaxID=3198878 RepID=UPI00315962CD
MAANNESADEKLARELQRQFDEEAHGEEASYRLAVSLAGRHDISDSDSDITIEPENTSPSSPDLFQTDLSYENQSSHNNSTAGINRSTTVHDISDSSYSGEEAERSCTASSSGGELKTNRSLHDISASDSDTEPSTSLKDQRSQSSLSLKRKSGAEESLDSNISQKRRKTDLDRDSVGSEEDVATQPLAGDDEENSKPLCKYGSKCYRKNPSHRAEFRHTEDHRPSSAEDKSSKQSFKSSGSHRRTFSEVYEEAQPVSLFLTKVSGIPALHNGSFAVHIKDILSSSMGNLMASAQFNYMFDIPWLVQQYPKEFRSKPMLLIHGEDRQAKSALHAEAEPFPNIRLCQAKLEIMYGTHHTKMMFLLYDSGLRVVIHTCNLIENDWYQKTQGVWISPVFPKLKRPPPDGAVEGDSVTHFKRDLLAYLSAYKSHLLSTWINHIKEHDMAAARVHIVGSVPGRHLGEKKDAWGHLRLRKLLQQSVHGDSVRKWPVIGQFSSIGSLGADKSNWLCGEWLQSLGACRQLSSSLSSPPPLHLIFPSKDNVRLSLEGYPGGGCLPYSINVAKKQTYLHTFFHQWKSDGRGRSRACPHIKTYLRASPNWSEAAWFLVTSANLSKAAWGATEKKGSQLMIRSYELGVLFIPKHFTNRDTFTMSSSLQTLQGANEPLLPLPYDLPPTPYGNNERPWMWDVPCTDLPDSHGNIWCPPR